VFSALSATAVQAALRASFCFIFSAVGFCPDSKLCGFSVRGLGGVSVYAVFFTAVSPTTNANALANALVTDPNITIISATLLNNSAQQQGTLSGGAGLLPFNSGIFLTSGSMLNAPGPNNVGNLSASTASGSYSLNGFGGGQDANVLGIVFTTQLPNISFQYTFGSEEYNEFLGSQFDDKFAF
jgi:hypothetical protein